MAYAEEFVHLRVRSLALFVCLCVFRDCFFACAWPCIFVSCLSQPRAVGFLLCVGLPLLLWGLWW